MSYFHLRWVVSHQHLLYLENLLIYHKLFHFFIKLSRVYLILKNPVAIELSPREYISQDRFLGDVSKRISFDIPSFMHIKDLLIPGFMLITLRCQVFCACEIAFDSRDDLCRLANWGVVWMNDHCGYVGSGVQIDVPRIELFKLKMNVNMIVLPIDSFLKCSKSDQLSSV
jgi:hypothetical protein